MNYTTSTTSPATINQSALGRTKQLFNSKTALNTAIVSNKLSGDIKNIIRDTRTANHPYFGLKVRTLDNAPKDFFKTMIKIQVKTHKRKRINKKCAKRYGFREEEGDCFYLIDETKLPKISDFEFSMDEKKMRDKTEFRVRVDYGWRY